MLEMSASSTRHMAKSTFNNQRDSDYSLVLMRRFRLATSEMLVRAGGGHFEHA